MDKYKVIDFKTFEAFEREKEQLKQSQELTEKLASFPKLTQKKLKQVLQVLEDNGVSIDSTGKVQPIPGFFDTSWNILPYAVYCVRGKEKPAEFDRFVNLIAEFKFPKGLLSTKVAKDVKKTTRRKVN
ncbi:unnamed protein product [Orchesella dallaii]|uniref:Uncharacterized protein n=1 Tax=Orchesella dallaii TaxID=48710 RepID=A0ABP1R3S2_9HEXA